MSIRRLSTRAKTKTWFSRALGIGIAGTSIALAPLAVLNAQASDETNEHPPSPSNEQKTVIVVRGIEAITTDSSFVEVGDGAAPQAIASEPQPARP